MRLAEARQPPDEDAVRVPSSHPDDNQIGSLICAECVGSIRGRDVEAPFRVGPNALSASMADWKSWCSSLPSSTTQPPIVIVTWPLVPAGGYDEARAVVEAIREG